MNFLVQQQPAFVYNGGHSFETNKPTIIFIHGAANDSSLWHALLALTHSAAHNLIAVDLPGHGATFAVAKTHIEEYANWLIDLLDNGAMANAILVGHSMGSLIAIDCARRYPKRVAGMVLIGTALPMPVAEKVLDMARNDVEAAYDMVTRASFAAHKNADGSFINPSDAMAVAMKNHRAKLSKNNPSMLATDMQACSEYQINVEAIKCITASTLVIIGEKDRMTSVDSGMAVSEALPNATHKIIAGAGHMMPIEAPSEIADALGIFVANVLLRG